MLDNLFKYLPEPNYKAYFPLHFNEVQIGWVHHDHLEHLLQFPTIFAKQRDTLQFTDQFIRLGFRERTEKLAEFSRALYEIGFITNWRDEAYGIYYPNEDLQEALFTIERGVAPLLGFRVFGVHINGFVTPNSGDLIEKMWIAKRSKLKLIEPHKLDNLAAGGLSFGESPLETAIREAMEEANIPKALTKSLSFAGPLSYLAEFNKTIRNECIFIFDLPLPQDFSPTINDGEVEAFYCLPPSKVERSLLDGELFKPNSGIVTLHFMLRHQLTHFKPNETQYLQERLAISN